jgi:biotin carboxyl carrier protein
MDVELGEIKQVSLGSTLKVNGQLELPPQNKASVSAIIGGRVESVAVIEGDYVKKGQVIAILEAMKIMNELEAEFDCKILEVLAKNAQAVEYDMPLFIVKKI